MVSLEVVRLATALHLALGKVPTSGQIILNFNDGRLASVQTVAHERVSRAAMVDNSAVDRSLSSPQTTMTRL